MSADEWLILAFLLTVQGVLGALAWYDLGEKLKLLLSARTQPLSGEPLPEPFTLTDQEAAMAEAIQKEESHQRETLLAASAKRSRRVR